LFIGYKRSRKIIESEDLNEQLNCKNNQNIAKTYHIEDIDYTGDPLRGYITVYYLSYIYYRNK
jgi:hypothetical protein